MKGVLAAFCIPVAGFGIGWGLLRLLSGVLPADGDVSLLFLLWLGFLPSASGWALGRWSPSLRPRLLLGAALFWGSIPCFFCLWAELPAAAALLLWMGAFALLAVVGGVLGAAHGISLRMRAFTEEEKTTVP